MRRLRLLALTGLLTLGPTALAQDQQAAEPKPQAEQPGLVLRDLLVIQTDRYDDTANNPKLIPTTLSPPIKHRGRSKRTSIEGAYEHEPMPLGLITFEGELAEPMKLRLTLSSSRDRFHAHWPDNALVGGQFIQWQSLVTADKSTPAVPFNDEQAWLDAVRGSEDRTAFQSRGGRSSERLLLYDASFRFKPALELGFKNDQYALTSRAPEQAAPPTSVLLRKLGEGWLSSEAAAPWAQPVVPIAEKSGDSDTGITLSEALAPIKELLLSRGYNANEIELALGMIGSAGLDKSGMSLVYVLPVGIIDEHVRLQVRPAPDKMIRTAIVVVNNVDPDLGSQVNALLDDLGSEKWIVRDRAQKQLIALGQAAIKKVQQLKNHDDPEVAFRARQILDAYDWKMQGDK